MHAHFAAAIFKRTSGAQTWSASARIRVTGTEHGKLGICASRAAHVVQEFDKKNNNCGLLACNRVAYCESPASSEPECGPIVTMATRKSASLVPHAF